MNGSSGRSSVLPGNRFGAVYAWPEGEGWRYLPAAPSAQRNAAGKAQFTLIEAGEVLILTVGTALALDDAQWTAARVEIADRIRQPVSTLDLRPADARPRRAALNLTAEGAGSVIELAHALPSPLPPHAAAISVMLRDEQARRVRTALHSGTERLEVRYEIDLPTRRTVTAHIRGTAPGHGDVQAALAAGDLVLTLQADPDASEALKTRAREAALAEATRLLAATAATRGRDADASVSAPAPASAPAADCHPDRRGAHPGGAPPPGTTTSGVGLIDAQAICTETATRNLELVANVVDWL